LANIDKLACFFELTLREESQNERVRKEGRPAMREGQSLSKGRKDI
jgi:hypothetical protein